VFKTASLSELVLPIIIVPSFVMISQIKAYVSLFFKAQSLFAINR